MGTPPVDALSRTRRPSGICKSFAVLRALPRPPRIKKMFLLDKDEKTEPSAARGDLLAYLHCLDNGKLNRGRGKPSLRKGFSAKS